MGVIEVLSPSPERMAPLLAQGFLVTPLADLLENSSFDGDFHSRRHPLEVHVDTQDMSCATRQGH